MMLELLLPWKEMWPAFHQMVWNWMYGRRSPPRPRLSPTGQSTIWWWRQKLSVDTQRGAAFLNITERSGKFPTVTLWGLKGGGGAYFLLCILLHSCTFILKTRAEFQIMSSVCRCEEFGQLHPGLSTLGSHWHHWVGIALIRPPHARVWEEPNIVFQSEDELRCCSMKDINCCNVSNMSPVRQKTSRLKESNKRNHPKI